MNHNLQNKAEGGNLVVPDHAPSLRKEIAKQNVLMKEQTAKLQKAESTLSFMDPVFVKKIRGHMASGHHTKTNPYTPITVSIPSTGRNLTSIK